MKMDDEFLEINDLDFFASFVDGFLAHFATAGRGFVPSSIRNSIPDYELVYEYIMSLGEDCDYELVEVNIPVFSTAAQRDRYLESFILMAKKGLFSYDARSDGYALIAMPKKGRGNLELPVKVKLALGALTLASRESVELINESSFF